MRKLVALCLLLLTFSWPSLTAAQQPDEGINTVPRYGYAPKTAAQLALDQEFIATTLRQHGGNRAAAANASVDFGWRYFYQEDLLRSIKRFNQAWLLDSSNADVYYGFSAYLTQRGDTSGARRFRQLGQGFDVNQQAAVKYYSRLADLHNKQRDARRVIDDYQHLLAINPRFPGAHSIIGYNYSQLQDTTRARRHFDLATAANPRDSLTFNNKGWMYYEHKRYPQAVAAFNQALAVNPGYVSALVNRGLAQLDGGNPAAALADFKRCLELAPTPSRGQFHVLVGKAKLQLNDRPGACSAFRLALALNDAGVDQQAVQELYSASCR
jgi:tetratricopeptide (TPR) repeat protein